jgi:pre-mRNA-splicing factor CWC22
VNEEEQITHMISMEDELSVEDNLNVFQYDEAYEDNENKYRRIINDILGEDSAGSGDENSDGDSDDESGDGDSDAGSDGDGGGTVDNKRTTIIDNTETNKIGLRRTIYLTIQSSLNFEECAHKLLRLQLKDKQVEELANMIIDCCAQQRTYIKFYGLLGQRFCQIDKHMSLHFEVLFKTCYETIQRFETNKLRNVAKFFSHLLYTDSISWLALSCIHLSEEETCSSSRVFIKILIQDLSEYMGLPKLIVRIKDETLSQAFEGLFPRIKPQDTRFSINFFTSIGLGALTEDLREHLKNAVKKPSIL